MRKASSKSELRSNKVKKEKFGEIERSPLYVVLDNFKSAYNVGTIFRLADALLIKKIFLCGTTIVPPNHKLKTTSRGTERWVPWEYAVSTVDVVKKLKSNGVSVVCAEITEESEDYMTFLPSFPLCLVLGREFDGVSPEVLDLADSVVSLPIYGMTNSLNVASTASVLLYHFSELLKQKNNQ